MAAAIGGNPCSEWLLWTGKGPQPSLEDDISSEEKDALDVDVNEVPREVIIDCLVQSEVGWFSGA